MARVKDGHFANFDDESTYRNSQERALLESTRNFVVQFGEDGADIAWDFQADGLSALLRNPSPAERPVRWINIWAPHRQVEIVDLLGKHYGFSPRLLAIIGTAPPESRHLDKPLGRLRTKIYRQDDIELATTRASIELPTWPIKSQDDDISHYALANQMINYQSHDVGTHFLCVGANWIHELKPKAEVVDEEKVSEGRQKRLFSWLVLCDDHTVISLQEDFGQLEDSEDVAAIRSNTLSVLSQLSIRSTADAISLQSVRQALKLDATKHQPGIEGSSLLFHYLFDDWRAVYSTVATYNKRLDDLQCAILGEVTRKSNSSPSLQIILRLHILGRQIRSSQHLYEGYKNLIKRILEPKPAPVHLTALSRSSTNLSAGPGGKGNGVTLSSSAAQRFERISDRLELLILSETKELLAEKEALVSTYFNINAQKDSEATARLTRSATLLAKLSVLFLPVSLMTSYFSIQVQDLEGVYTVNDYWYSFAAIMSISFLCLFFFSRLLMYVTETLDGWMRTIYKSGAKSFTNVLRKRDEVQS
ncbi:uncharacterized protein L3040_003262 [Drepanopeziza brunnea f. sp. 'multigermtubi']|uniref:ADP-ribosylation factor n=1 Tax=Marssonina brunnea f. sp. multigermtubi (strain MB_m1) TaxID=1072389 RepID=K1WS53_MARBU|nr:uncharacterized protein MBM_05892 [Drepanopeziza brunnea f. sp. 'multigermtubi' MB_m1]EKD15881.1 hypothetical protein MBM_05892 [Drepanopeziza brunnea f. sp. 'multigermtubi' MB_m1]KAJ5047435.1 hypothetical protein L3040_003262 [Drepanopeziza brunnea f. sp. 'multigermtubi']